MGINLDARYWILDDGQIMDDLIPTSRLEGDVLVGNTRCWMLDAGLLISSTSCKFTNANFRIGGYFQ